VVKYDRDRNEEQNQGEKKNVREIHRGLKKEGKRTEHGQGWIGLKRDLAAETERGCRWEGKKGDKEIGVAME
jgi:hypothetical protein